MKMDEADSELPTFERMMLPHLDAAYNLARWLLRNDHDAEDSVQDACVRAWRAFAQFRGEDGRAWFLTIVRNVCYTHLQQSRKRGLLSEFNEDEHGVDLGSATVIETIDREADSDRLKTALEELPPEYREVVVLHDVQGLAYKEIASIANIPIGTVMSRLSRGRNRLQQAVNTQFKKDLR